MMLLWILILVLAIVALVKGADWFTEGAESLGIRLGIAPFVVGVTIVSIGTSLPELASSIVAVLAGNSEIVIANVVGSNIANILFVLGLGAVIAGVKTKRDITKIDLPILLGTTILLFIFCFDGTFSRVEAGVFLLLTVAYLTREFLREKIKVEEHLKGEIAIYALIGGLFLVVVGARVLIEAVIELSLLANISTEVISASIVAFGTSVPEAVVTVVAVVKNQREIALGNIIGSNVFNILLIAGVAGMISPLVVHSIMTVFAIPVLFAVTLLLGWLMRDKKLNRIEGCFFLVLYVLFIVKLFV